MAEDETTSNTPDTPEADADSGRASRLRRRLGTSSGDSQGRPLSVYIILIGGVAALVVLLFVVYLSSDRTIPDQPICSTVSMSHAQDAVLEGRVRGVTIAYDDEAEPPSASNWGPVLIRINYTDGQCANLPQGISQQDGLYQMIGAIQVYNDITENQQVEIKYDRTTELNESLFFTPTPVPTETPEPTPSPTATQPVTRESTPAATPDADPLIGPTLPNSTPDAE